MGEVFFHERDVPEKVTGAREQTDPGQTTNYVIVQESGVMHGADACHKGSKSADNGYEAAEEDGLVTVFFIKLLRFFHMFRFDQPVMAFQQFLSEFFSYPIVAGIA